jgi:alpha-1,2-mannosyltransferase
MNSQQDILVDKNGISDLNNIERQIKRTTNDFRESDLMISIGQFRPEKDHRLQLSSLAVYKSLMRKKPLKLVMIGSCRGEQDQLLVSSLRSFAINDLKLVEGDDFEFAIGLPKSDLDLYMERATIGIHTMWNEHFGIGIVEMMQSGCLVIAHNSGGPKEDIISAGSTGFLASTPEEYAERMDTILSKMSPFDREKIQNQAKRSILRYTEERFGSAFIDAIKTSVSL